MKYLSKLFAYGKPLWVVFVPFILCSILYTLFGLFNFTLLVPLFDVLFSKEMPQAPQIPTFSFTIGYLNDIFYYYFLSIAQQHGKTHALLFVCSIIIVSVLLTNVFLFLSIRIIEYLRATIIENLRQDLFQKIINLHLGYFSEQRKGDLIARISADSLELEAVVTNTMRIIKEPFKLVGFFLALFLISAELTLFSIFFIPLAGGIVAWLVSKLRHQTDLGQKTFGNMITIVEEAIGALRIIKAFQGQQYIASKFYTENHNYGNVIRKTANTREMASPVSEFLGVLVVSGILLYGGSLVLSGETNLTASQFVTYIILFSQVMQPAKTIAGAYSTLQRGFSAAERVFSILDTPEEVTNQLNAKEIKGFEKSIEFRNVSFKYNTQWVLKNISFTIQKGETLALVGETGSGKSTIADLIPRFYDVQEGEILIDGINIKDINKESLLELIGIVSQEPILFNDTIYNNIAFANPKATPSTVEEAAKIAFAHDFIMQSEQGYQTSIGDRGMKLAGGQRQRLTIARAVLKNPALLILDEATSALDNESEKIVQVALESLMQNRTSLVIAHRLSTVQKADRIIVLKQGEIVEIGSHQELIAKENGYYKKLHTIQQS
ncbi:MAG: ABC transporter ATP-binding protein [Cytophagales bacterium]|nr:MAG: ABC transporter ATP-binding protein [Cytophagales bacterium]